MKIATHTGTVHVDPHEAGFGGCPLCGGESVFGTLTSECPGEPMAEVLRDAVRDGEMDYRDGAWWMRCERGERQ